MKHGAATVQVYDQARMTAANAVHAKQRELVDFNAIQGSSFKHRTCLKKELKIIEANRRTLDSQAIFKSQHQSLFKIAKKYLNERGGL